MRQEKTEKKKRSGLESIFMAGTIFLGVVSILLGALLARENSAIAGYNARLTRIQNTAEAYVQIERSLREGSDLLTDCARNYVVTGNRVYLDAYFVELEERGHRDDAIQMLSEIEHTDEAYNILVKAKKESDDLAKVEEHAMALAALAYGENNDTLRDELLYYDLIEYERSLSADEQKSMAKDLLFSDIYERSRRKIYSLLDSFLDESLRSIEQNRAGIIKELNMSVRYQNVLTYSFLLFLLCSLMMLVRINRAYSNSDREIGELADKVKQLNSDLEKMTKQRDEANNARNVFLSNMSGIMRSPINSIIDHADVTMRFVDDPKRVTDHIRSIDHEAQILLDLVNEVLALGRSERGMVTMRHDPMEIIGFFNSCAGIVKGITMDAGINLTRDVGLILHPNVLGDELHLRQVILNIVDNSIKFTREGGVITLRINEEIVTESGTDKAVFVIEVEDTGTGMSRQYVKNMFESFSGIADAMAVGNGLGIGMSITRRYVELMGGTINVESELQVGTKYTVRIPMDIYRAPTQSMDAEKVKQLDGAHILIAEDNELNMEIARKMLIEEGATVSSAENGLIALSLYRSSEEGSFDAILMDVAMPVLDGIAAAKEIRASARNDARTVPIIAMIASSTDDDINMLLDAGMSDYIAKPVDVTQLVRTLLASMKKQSNELAERLEKALRDANTDALTGVKNRNAYELSTGRINVEIESSNEKVEFMIVICDVNGLKSINDNIGHDEGNKLLVNACRLICRTFKRSPVFRIGGDEFVAILRNDDYENRATLIGGLMERMTAENYDPMDVNNVSFAIGAADFDPTIDKDCGDVFKRADAMMYEHKKSIKGEGNIR